MPDQDRKASFMHSLNQDPGEGAARCPSCRGTAGLTFQDDCVCCGRGVIVCQASTAEDVTNSVKALRIKTEVPEAPQPVIIPSFFQENKPLNPFPAAGLRPSNERQRHSNIPIVRPGIGTRYASLGQLQQRSAGDNSRISQQRPHYSVGQSSSSSRRGSLRGSSRGGGGRGTGGAHPTFKGVRTRKGVKGWLVEIRPPKWKKTIWLGTYNTSIEAAGAYDAGVFYTKKSNTKYNFDTSEGFFPPLPSHLRLDRPSNMEAIKLFVQNQAKDAARRMGNNNALNQVQVQVQAQINPAENNRVSQPTSSCSCVTGSDSTISVSVNDKLQISEDIDGIDSEFQIPMDVDFLSQCLHEEAVKDMVLDYTNFLRQQGGSENQELLPDEEEEM